MPDAGEAGVPEFDAAGVCAVVDASSDARGPFLSAEEYLQAFR